METKELIILTDELAEELMEELALSHPNTERLVRYVWLVQSYPLDRNGVDYYRENLPKWIEQEQESYYGEHESVSDFAQTYYQEYWDSGELPSWLLVDWQGTWDYGLRHDFTAEDNGSGIWVWADIY